MNRNTEHGAPIGVFPMRGPPGRPSSKSGTLTHIWQLVQMAVLSAPVIPVINSTRGPLCAVVDVPVGNSVSRN